jgi:ribosomal protein S18 acetylase RimI-like enzyme
METSPNNPLEKEITISRRQATDADTEFARTTHHAALRDLIVRQFGNFDEKMQDEFFAKSWKPETHEIIVNDDINVGYCCITHSPDHIFLSELILLPSAQGKGIGTKIINELIEESKAKNIPITLQVLKENQAQQLYRKMGFKDTETTSKHIQMEFSPSQTKTI